MVVADYIPYAITILLSTIAWLIRWGVNRIVAQVDTMNTTISINSGKISNVEAGMAEMKAWADGHEALDNERHGAVMAKLEGVAG